MKQTPTTALLEIKLGEPLGPFVEAMLADDRSFPYIARKIRERTDNQVRFSDEALRQWFKDSEVGAS